MARKRSGGRARAAIFLVISLAAAAAFTVVIFQLIQGYQRALAEAEKAEEKREVVVATITLHQGQTLIDSDVSIMEVPPAFVPETTFQFREDVIGRVPRERILAGEFIREERLADPESGVGLNAIIPRGMRAVSINISDGSSVSGFLNPGNYVDILVTLVAGEKKEKTITLIQACYVLAVDARMGGSTSAAEGKIKPSVTLAVTPEQAEDLAHAHNQGEVTLTLRNDIDVTEVETHGAQKADLIGGEKKLLDVTAIPPKRGKVTPTKPPEPTTTTIRIIRGSSEKDVEVQR